MLSTVAPSATLPERLARYSAAYCRTAAYIAACAASAPFLYHLVHRSTAYLGLFEDDYFYYAVVADKLVSLGKISYDGFTTTNGFHPLWLIVITVVRLVCGRFGPGFYVALTGVFLVSTIATYELGRVFALRLGASEEFAPVVASTYSLATARLLTSGMECAVAVPLFLWFLIEVGKPRDLTPRRAAWLGFLASLAVLGRLDLGIAVAILGGGFIVFTRPRLATFARLVAAFCFGGVLVPIYAVSNLAVFGSALPVSALAKRLQTAPGFNFWYARAVAQWTIFGPTVGIVLPLGLVALCLVFRRDPEARPSGRLVGAVALVFAFVFFGVNALTGWIYFGWYSYPLVPALIAAQVFIYERWAALVRQASVRVVVAVLVVALTPAFAIRYYIEHGPRWSIADNSMLAMSYQLAEHMSGRPGLIGMGAIAGIATYVLDRPVFQLEGIVADRDLVEHIRREDPLPDVLRKYGVRYLVVSLVKVRAESNDGCQLVTQPHAEWAGERVAKLRGEICDEPVEHFFTPGGTNPWSTFPAIETLVWGVPGSHWRKPLDVTLSRTAP